MLFRAIYMWELLTASELHEQGNNWTKLQKALSLNLFCELSETLAGAVHTPQKRKIPLVPQNSFIMVTQQPALSFFLMIQA